MGEEEEVREPDYLGFIVFISLSCCFLNSKFYANISYYWMVSLLFTCVLSVICGVKAREWDNGLSDRFGLLYTVYGSDCEDLFKGGFWEEVEDG